MILYRPRGREISSLGIGRERRKERESAVHLAFFISISREPTVDMPLI